MGTKRTVFFVSDQTGVTAETMGHSLLTQFDGLDFSPVTLPFISTVDKAAQAVARINAAARQDGARPVVFSTLVNDEVREVVMQAECLYLDFFEAFLGPMEQELGQASSHALGRAHGMTDVAAYTARINATNFALANDDGTQTRDYERADVILIGVSRSGKTPTCVYMALQYGIYAANYPLVEDYYFTGDQHYPIFNLELATDLKLKNFTLGLNAGYRYRQPGEDTTGGRWPVDGERCESGDVVFLTAEDDPADAGAGLFDRDQGHGVTPR